jgi:hypothetical protein
MSAEGAEAVHEILASSIDEVRNKPIDLSKTYTNKLLNDR